MRYGMENSLKVIQYAQTYINSGFKLIRLYGVNERGICTCKKKEKCSSPGKHPSISSWVKNATSDIEVVKKWFEEAPDSNIAIVTGKVSDIEVVDVDPKNGGNSSLRELWESSGGLTPTFTVITGSGGAHFYYNYSNPGIKNGELIKGIDWKSDNGYVVAPPSKHASLNQYQAILDFDYSKYLEGEYSNAAI
jgi:putative DNA primase/helicase